MSQDHRTTRLRDRVTRIAGSQYYGNYPRILSPVYETTHDKLVHRRTPARSVLKDSGPWDWVAGAYFNHRIQDNGGNTRPLEGFGAWSQIPGSGMPPGCTVENPRYLPLSDLRGCDSVLQGGHSSVRETRSIPI